MPIRSLHVLGALALIVLACGCGDGAGKERPAAVLSTKPSPTGPPPNGVEKLNAQVILERAAAASRSAQWIHIKSKFYKGKTLRRLELHASKEVGTCKIVDGGGTLEIIRLRDVAYGKGDRAFWTAKASAAHADLLAGKYLKITNRQKAAAEWKQLSSTGFTEGLLGKDSMNAVGNATTNAAVQQIDGVPTVVVITDDLRVNVAATGKPYVLRLAAPDDTEYFAFSDYDKPVVVQAPPADQVVDLDALRKARLPTQI